MKPGTKKCSWIFSPVPTERGDLDRKYLDRLLHLPLSSSPPILTHWYTWCKSALAVVVHLVHIGTPLTKATLTSTSLQNCYSDTLTQLVPTPNQRELLIDCSAQARQWHIVLCSKIRSYKLEIALPNLAMMQNWLPCYPLLPKDIAIRW